VTYRIHVSEAAVKQLNRLPKPTRIRLWQKIRALPNAPRSAGTKPLEGALKHMRSLRVSDYRAIYVVDDAARTIEVTHVGHRSRLYADAERDV
jgi:mRNA interferase RelE/StbE